MHIEKMSIAQLIKEYKQAKENSDRIFQSYINSDDKEKWKSDLEEANRHCLNVAIAIANTLTYE